MTFLHLGVVLKMYAYNVLIIFVFMDANKADFVSTLPLIGACNYEVLSCMSRILTYEHKNPLPQCLLCRIIITFELTALSDCTMYPAKLD